MAHVDRHETAWRIDSDEGEETGVLVRHNRHWWLLCPATATLFFDHSPQKNDCSDPECNFESIHAQAADIMEHVRVAS